jgi:serine phosphatase RsbU (regulator of sigma subunit)
MAEHHSMQCMEIWGGSHEADTAVSTPGLDIYVLSKPYQGAKSGGDVHYVSLCGGGITTRVIIADLSGHGEALADLALKMRALFRKNINRKSHLRLVESLNQEFSGIADADRFATAVVATYLASRDLFTLCSAGHPRPLRYSVTECRWSLLEEKNGTGKSNLPLGIDDKAAYDEVTVVLEKGDIVLLYTDALIEAKSAAGKYLGESGLLDLVQRLDATEPASIGVQLLDQLKNYRGDSAADDDVTVLTLCQNGSRPKRLSLGQKLDVYAKVFGLKSV